ncbi:MAG: hypothetical protein KGQ93_09840 [Cyanobacteria bacterium REEB459]|nr:hypothetical protein [Cyanobacteria bacterium REEB459]
MAFAALRLIFKLLALSALISALIKYIAPMLNPLPSPGLLCLMLLFPSLVMAGLLALQPIPPDQPD